MLVPLLLSIAAGYLFGSLPVGYLVARVKGVNIFEVGSRSPGATNVRRVLGPAAGNLVFVLDVLKGAAATALPLAWFWFRQSAAAAPIAPDAVEAIDGSVACAVAGLIAALIGHSFSCFTRFRGGKGVATSVGGLLILLPSAAAIAAVVWLLVFYSSRYVSLASMCAAVALALAAWLLGAPPLLLGLSLIVAGFVILRHRANIVRLLHGTENKFVKRNANSHP